MRALRLLAPLALLACNQDVYVSSDKQEDPPDPVETDVSAPIDQPDIEVTPTKLTFGALPPGCPSDPQTFTIKNVGQAPLEVDAFEFVGPDAAYTVDKVGPITLPPNRKAEITVSFEAAVLTEYNVRINVLSNDPDEPTVRVALTGEGAQSAFREEFFQQPSADDVDVLWIIDQSCSMSDNNAAVRSAMGRFIQNFVNLGLDYHMGVTTVDMTAEAGRFRGPWIDRNTVDGVTKFQAQMAAGSGGVGEETGFAAITAALSSPLIDAAPNAGFLRTDAKLAVVVVADEDDRDANPDNGNPSDPSITDDFIDFLQGLKADPADVSFSALTCGRTSCPEYVRAVQTIGGVKGNINARPIDVNPFLSQVSYVAGGLVVEFPLTSVPVNTSPSAITVTVDGQPVPFDPTHVNGWTYDADTNSIVFWGDAIPSSGQTAVVRYPYDAGC